MSELELTRLLEELGLTEYEAKTLGAMFKLSEAEAPEISRLAQVPKTRVYDVLDRLTKKGLIIEIFGRPKKYRVESVDSVFECLISSKRADLKKLEDRAEKLKGLVLSKNGLMKDASERVMKVKDKNDFMRILSKELEGAKKSVVGFTTLGKDYRIVNDCIRGLSDRNVEVKLVAKIAQESAHVEKDYKSRGIDMKNADHGIHAYVVDGKKVILALSDLEQQKPEYHFTIWQENLPMAAALNSYFNTFPQGKKNC